MEVWRWRYGGGGDEEGIWEDVQLVACCAVFLCCFFGLKREERVSFLHSRTKVRALAPAFMHGEEAGGSVGPLDDMDFCWPIRFEYFTT